MADNSFRTTRRDGAARDLNPSGGQQFDDPLAELARLIGRAPPASQTPDHAAQPQYDAPPADAPQAEPQWPADARYAEQHPGEQYSQYDDRQSQSGEGQYGDGQYGERQYGDGQHGEGQHGEREYTDRQYDDRYDTPRFADQSPPYRPAPPSYNADYEQPDQYAAPQERDARGYSAQPHYDDAHDPIQEVPAFLPRMRDDRYGYAQQRGHDRASDRRHDQGYDQDYDQEQDPEGYGRGYGQQNYEQGYAQAQEGDPDQSYALEDYEDEYEEPAPRRRGFAVAAALLGVMVLGTAGAFGYRAMFGGSMIPGLPPIIRADSTPNKIIPPGGSANASGQASASSASPDRLVSREERPVDVPAPPGTPRVVSTVPVFPDPNAGLQSSVVPGGQNMAGRNLAGAVASGAAPGGAMSLGPTAAPAYGSAAAVPMPGPSAMSQSPPLQSPPVAGAGNAKKIHTVAIHTGPPDNSDAAASAPSAHAQSGRPAPSRPVAAAPSQGGNSPMSIVPSPGDADTSRTRTALAHPASEPAPAAAPAGGGYMVQVSSQRSESDAQAAYRGLQAKFPSQLGGHEATIRQVDLGEKGTYFRTLVGPYATMEQAAQMCSSLKAAGGSCLLQRN